MSRGGVEVKDQWAAAVATVLSLFAGHDESLELELDPELVQALLVVSVRMYAGLRAQGLDKPGIGPGAISATEAAIVARALLDAADLELFELTLWNGWGPK